MSDLDRILLCLDHGVTDPVVTDLMAAIERIKADERAHIRAELLAKYEINEVIDVADMLAIIDKEGSEPQCGNPFCENGYDEMNNEPCACIIDEDDSDD